MSKPKWCPQEVWEQARYYWRKDGCSTRTPNTYARALLDAKREAYEEAAKMAIEHAKPSARKSMLGRMTGVRGATTRPLARQAIRIAKAVRAKAEGLGK